MPFAALEIQVLPFFLIFVIYRTKKLIIYLFIYFLFILFFAIPLSWGTPLHSSRFHPSPARPKGGGWQVSGLYLLF